MSARRHVETTHAVTNQPPPLADYDAYALDAPLREAARRLGSEPLERSLAAYGKAVGSAEMIAEGEDANRHPPELRSHDRFGHRIDEVVYHPAYHALMARAMAHGVHSVAWTAREHGHFAHAALLYLHGQAEAGTACPLTMTHAAVPALRADRALGAAWEAKLCQPRYDGRSLPVTEKHSATLGMAMTEKQGGSDVRANTTRAVPFGAAGPGEAYALTGHKWFCSAPMSDAFLSLAQTERGLSCFLVPRFMPDGRRNRIFIQRLKDKLGNRSNASSEIEYDKTYGLLLGEDGRGVATILHMVAQTRVDCAAGSAGLMRQALVQAIHHARHRAAFGKRLAEQPLMLSVLADLALEVEAAASLSLRVAQSYDEGRVSEYAQRFGRLATPIAKYWVTRRAPELVFEAMECLGGAGYVEESGLPRIYRETPVNSIWEGSGNVQCLDVLRALRKDADGAEALIAEIGLARGADRQLDAQRERLERVLRGQPSEASARQWVEELALALCASLLLRGAPADVADAFCRTRLGRERGFSYGSLPADLDARALVARAFPE